MGVKIPPILPILLGFTMKDLSDIIKQETRDGRAIVQFLLSAMQGEFQDFKPCHQLDAARQLIKFGFDPARSFLDQHNSIKGPAPTAARIAAQEPQHEIHPELARIIREETQDGKTAVCFLIDVMEGTIPNFKPHHRINAAKELLRLGFPTEPTSSARKGAKAEAEAEPVLTPEEIEAQRKKKEKARQRKEHVEFSLHGRIYYDMYPYPCVCEDRRHDCNGKELTGEALKEAAEHPPVRDIYFDYPEDQEEFKKRCADYFARRNAIQPDDQFDFSKLKWRKIREPQHGDPPHMPQPRPPGYKFTLPPGWVRKED